MIEETATVVKTDEFYVWIEVMDKSACNQCQAGKGCGQSMLGKLVKTRENILKLQQNEFPVKAGDKVIVGIDERVILKGSMLMYLLPILFIFVFALFGSWLSDLLNNLWFANNVVATVFGLAGLLVSLKVAKAKLNKVCESPEALPTIVKMI